MPVVFVFSKSTHPVGILGGGVFHWSTPGLRSTATAFPALESPWGLGMSIGFK